jgi:hypothetical protein
MHAVTNICNEKRQPQPEVWMELMYDKELIFFFFFAPVWIGLFSSLASLRCTSGFTYGGLHWSEFGWLPGLEARLA